MKNVLRTPRLNEYFRSLMLQSHNKETLKVYLMDKLKRAELFSVISDDQVSEEDALQALRAALSMYVTETDELMSQTDVKDAKGMLSGRIKHIREDVYNTDNL